MDGTPRTTFRRFAALTAAFALLMLAGTEAAAQEFHESVRSGGMGEAFTGIGTGTAGLYHNPAGIARARLFAIDAGFEYAPSGNILSASVVDSQTNPRLAAGVGYGAFIGRDALEDVVGHDLRVGLGVPVVPERVSVGLGGRWIFLNRTELVENDDGEEVPTKVQIIGGGVPTLDAGILFRASDAFHLGIAGQNLIDKCKKPECEHVAPTTITGAISFGNEVGLLVDADVGIDLTSGDDVGLNVNAGAEYMIQKMFPIRAGYIYEGVPQDNLLTFGGGWRSKTAGVDLAYQLNLNDTTQMYFMGSFSVYLSL